MKNNIKLNNEQMKALNIAAMTKCGVILVKGVAGSGKTTLAVQQVRAIINSLAQEDMFKSRKKSICLITYNKSLSNI